MNITTSDFMVTQITVNIYNGNVNGNDVGNDVGELQLTGLGRLCRCCRLERGFPAGGEMIKKMNSKPSVGVGWDGIRFSIVIYLFRIPDNYLVICLSRCMDELK